MSRPYNSPPTVVLTGCSRGLGRALAEHFAQEGAVVMGCARRREDVEALRAQFGKPHDFVVADVTDEGLVSWWAQRVLDMRGAPDFLINNAGTIAPNMPLWDVPPAEISRVLDVNVAGTITVIRHFVPAMIERGSGVVVNFSSGWGRSTAPEVGIYCASKWAIEGLTRSLAQELPRGVSAVAVNPGIIDTDMLRSCFGEAAGGYPSPKAWAAKAGPFILSLGNKQNGRSVDVPGIPVD